MGGYVFGAVYTLKTETNHDKTLRGSRKGVEPQGLYYAYFTHGKIHIYDDKQFASAVQNESNPYVNKFPPHCHDDPGVGQRSDPLETEWRQIQSYDNRPGMADVTITAKEVVGSENAVTHSTKVTESKTTGSMSFGVSQVLQSKEAFTHHSLFQVRTSDGTREKASALCL